VTRGRVAAGAAVLVAVVLALGVAAVVAPRLWHGNGGSYAPKKLVVRTSVTPRRALFGDLLTARVDVALDPRRIRASSLAVAARFRPFTTLDERSSTRRVGRSVLRTTTYVLQCIQRACLPARPGTGRARVAAASFVFPLVHVTATGVDGKRIRASSAWNAVGVQSRLTAHELALQEPVAETPLRAPRVTWRIAPSLVGVVAVVLAILLVLGAGALVASALLRDARPLRVLRIPPHLTPVERALILAEHASRTGETDESRKALERLAAELRRRGAASTADDAERLAWSAAGPTPDTVGALAQEVRTNGAH
jgi:hypothetical protein